MRHIFVNIPKTVDEAHSNCAYWGKNPPVILERQFTEHSSSFASIICLEYVKTRAVRKVYLLDELNCIICVKAAYLFNQLQIAYLSFLCL